MTPIRFGEAYTDRPNITTGNADDYFVIGEPEEVAAAIERRIETRVTEFTFRFVDFPDAEGMQLFADEVMPEFR